MNLKIKFELEETELNGEIENLIPSSSGVSLPSGGTTGQVLTKNSDADGDAGWKEPYTYILPAATAQTLGGVKIGNGISIAEDGTISSEGSGSASAVLYTEQTLTDEQKTQALANIGGLSKNQGTANSGKFLGIGADGIVVPTEVGGGSDDISFPLLYEATTTEEVRWIDTGANAFRAKRRLIIQLISKATSSNSADNKGCGSIYTDGSPISSAFENYVLTSGMDAMLPKQYDRLNTFYGYRVNDDASWIFYHTNRTVVNTASTTLNCSNQNSAVSKKDITGFIIGDSSAAINEGTRVFGIGTEIKVWGV